MLNQTPKEIKERSALRINPAKTCQPLGAMYAALGIHNCLPHSHGSQGCCSYHRSHLTRHYKEPVMAATSSFTEGASVFGGSGNLNQAIRNIFTIYKPDVIAVHTTCLSETIGDDIPTIIGSATESGFIPEGKHVIHASTPSYVGSHVTGFSNMTKGMVSYLSESTGTKRAQINVIPGFVEPADMREMKRIAREMGVRIVMFPDTSDVFDAPQTGNHRFYPKGGVTVADMKTTGDSLATIACGSFASGDAAAALENKCGVPAEIREMPIGVSAMDKFIMSLKEISGVDVPESISEERGRLIDVIGDMQQYFWGKKAAVWGDPDQVIAMTEFLLELNMKPVHILTGTPGNRFEKKIKSLVDGVVESPNIKAAGDLFLMHQWIKNEPVDVMVGNSYGKYISRAEDIPLVRFGWPILDRIGHQYFPSVGYTGGIRIAEKLLSAIMDRIDRDTPEERFELIM